MYKLFMNKRIFFKQCFISRKSCYIAVKIHSYYLQKIIRYYTFIDLFMLKSLFADDSLKLSFFRFKYYILFMEALAFTPNLRNFLNLNFRIKKKTLRFGNAK